MKNCYYLLLILCIGFHTRPCYALSGNYSINPSAAATATNYKSFESAISDLRFGTRTDGGPSNTAGVSGPVVFYVAAGTYNEQVELSGMITGASPVNTITFEGTDAATRIIEYEAVSSSSRHTVKLENVKYVTLRNLTIRTLGEFGWAVHISGAGSNCNRVIKCSINASGYGSYTDYAGIMVNGSNTSASAGAPIDSLEIDSNTIEYGYYGIYMTGNFGVNQFNNKIRNNTVMSANYTAILVRSQNGVIVTGNTISSYQGQPGTSYGILVNTAQSGIHPLVISGNTIRSTTTAGISIGYAITFPGKSLVSNNMISKAFGSGISLEGCENIDILNNSISMNMAFPGTDGGISIIDGFGHTVFNNLVSTLRKSELVPLYVQPASAIDSMDYNVFYRADMSDQRLVYISGYYDQHSFRGASGFNMHSLFTKPLFLNDSNLRVVNSCIRGVSFPSVTRDIDGTLRTQPAVAGAHEGTTYRHNLTVNTISSPSNPLSGTGLYDVAVVVQNTGDTVVHTFSVVYELNNGTPVTLMVNDTLNPCDTMTVFFTGPDQASLGISNAIKTYTAWPNGISDPYPGDDTFYMSLYMPLSGNYTIGGTNPDFATFAEATTVLNSAGIAGPVTFTVRPGTYTGQVDIPEQILGASAVNTVVFDGLHQDSVLLTASSTTLDHPAVFHIGSGYVSVQNFTVRNSSMDNGYGILANRSGSSNLRIKNCRIEFPNGNASDNFGGIILAEGSFMFNEGDFRIDSVKIDSNTITNARAGIVHKNSEFNNVSNSTRISVTNNTIQNTAYGIVIEKADGIIVHGNNVSLDETDGFTAIDISISEAIDSTYVLEATNNRIANGAYSLTLSRIYNTTQRATLVANNVILARQRDGISLYEVHNANILHNSVRVDEVSDIYYIGALTGTDCSDLRILNNQVAVMPGSSPAPVLFFSGSNNGLVCDYNNFYKSTSHNFAYLDQWISKDAFINAMNQNAHSYLGEPGFVNDSLRTRNACLNGTATGIDTDINGLQRSNVPDIGAYEIIALQHDMAVEKVSSPVFPVAGGSHDVYVRVANRGSAIVNNFDISYAINNGTPVTQSWTGMLSPCDTTTIVFSGPAQVTVVPGAALTLKVYTSLVNAANDEFHGNDTIIHSVSTPLNGIYTVGGSNPHYNTLNSAVSDLNLRGVDGPVMFRIRTGTYTEHLEFSPVQGASDANTITFISDAVHADSVKLTYNATSLADNYILRFNGAHHYHIQYLTLQPLNATYCRVIDMIAPSSFDSVTHCRLAGRQVTTAVPQNNAVIYAYNFTGKANVFSYNTITDGSMGIYIYGLSERDLTDRNVIAHNTISGSYQSGVYLFYTSNTLVHGNTITQGSAHAAPHGIYCYYGDSATHITSNKVVVNMSGHGISVQQCDGTADKPLLIANNSVSVTGTKASHGIRNQASKWVKIYHNSVYVNTTNATGYAGYFHYQTIALHNNIDIRNNIFSNAGNGSAMFMQSTANTTVKSDFNNLHATATNLVQRGTPAANYQNITLWRNASGQDRNSVSYRAAFTSPTNLTPDPSDTASWVLNGYGMYLDTALINADINGRVRPHSYATGAPDLGAYEFTPTAVPPQAVSSGYLMPDSVQVFMFAGDTIARIKWGWVIPDAITVRRYAGVIPATISPSQDYMLFYTDMQATGIGTYQYDADVYYRENWIGTNPDRKDIVMSKKDGNNIWMAVFPSSIDTIRNLLSAQGLYTFSLFSGTNVFNPMPVKLLGLSAWAAGSDVALTWQTASEFNNKGFEIMRSADGKQFERIGFVKGKGNARELSQYAYTDRGILHGGTRVVYYRLKQVDNNGSSSLSSVVSVTDNRTPGNDLNCYPNPFSNEVYITLASSSLSYARVELFDITGKMVRSETYQVSEGMNVLRLSDMDELVSGIYFVSVSLDGEKKTGKLIK